ncbi:MAG TPA: zf-HC2 domain-containing protein [Anaerolineae bacterium]|nr:zf-HC2 domain-containing protein [Anaerolineae bacterium]
MRTEHVILYIEAYLDNQLPVGERRSVEAHLAVCPACTQHLQAARRLAEELKPTLTAALGHPSLPPALRQRVRATLYSPQSAPQPFWSWAAPGRVFNAVGTLVMVALLAVGVWAVIQGQLPGAEVLPEIGPLSPGNQSSEQATTIANTPTPLSSITPKSTTPRSILGDTLSPPTSAPAVEMNGENNLEQPVTAPLTSEAEASQELAPSEPDQTDALELPAGTIAFAFFNKAPGREVYEIHLISPDGSNHRLFPLDGVSEPALRPGHQLAYRAYSEPTSPRSLLSSNLEGEKPHRVGGYWEDAQPDWSPTEDRLIFASQREGDRRWRLYTSWGDGSAEINLRREGKSPTFAPDGFRFAFEACDNTGNRCGLWIGDLENSEYGSKPFLEDPLAEAPDWSPVADQIVYMANPGGNWDLYLVDSNGDNIRRLTDDAAIDGLPAWSPDGSWLAFLSDRGGNWGIWLLHVASGETRQVFNFDGGTFSPPNRPPYGQRDWYDEQISWSK